VPPLILVRYGELALKSPPVRREFEQRLRRNILDQFVAAGAECRIRADHGHFYLEAGSAPAAIALLRRVFGITSVSEVEEVATDRDAIAAALLRIAEPLLLPGASFAIRARRTGQHPFTSQELARDLGAAVLDRFPDRGLTVDLDTPAVELTVEVRGPRTYLSTGRRPGPGGLPLGVAGRVVALVDGPRGALGAYLMMKRGCQTALVTTPDGEPFVRTTLAAFDPHAVVREGSGDPTGTVESVATTTGADGVVLPLLVDDYPAARERWGERVVFSPTVGLDDGEVDARWRNVVALASA